MGQNILLASLTGKQNGKEIGTKNNLQRYAPNDLLPLAWSLILHFPLSPKIAPPSRDQTSNM